jgi:hypothetical protein
LPVCALWIGLGLEWLAGRPLPDVTARKSPISALERVGSVASAAAAALLATTLILGSLSALDRYYEDVRENARTGARILELVETAARLGPATQPVILDERLDRMSLGPGAGIVLRVLDLALEMRGVPTQTLWLGEQRPPQIRSGQLVILAARSKPRFTAEAVTGLGLRAPGGGPARVHSQASRYGLYEFGPGTVSAGRGGSTRDRGKDAVPGQSGARRRQIG